MRPSCRGVLLGIVVALPTRLGRLEEPSGVPGGKSPVPAAVPVRSVVMDKAPLPLVALRVADNALRMCHSAFTVELGTGADLARCDGSVQLAMAA